MAKQKSGDQLNVSSVTTQRLDPEVYPSTKEKVQKLFNYKLFINA